MRTCAYLLFKAENVGKVPAIYNTDTDVRETDKWRGANKEKKKKEKRKKKKGQILKTIKSNDDGEITRGGSAMH